MVARAVQQLAQQRPGNGLPLAFHHRGMQLVYARDKNGVLIVQGFYAHGILLTPVE